MNHDFKFDENILDEELMEEEEDRAAFTSWAMNKVILHGDWYQPPLTKQSFITFSVFS